MIQSKIIDAIEAYREAGGYSQTGFGLAAVADGQFLPRLWQGKCNLKTIQRAVDFMAANPLENAPSGAPQLEAAATDGMADPVPHAGAA